MNEFDKLKLLLKNGTYIAPRRKDSCLGAEYYINKNGELILTLSGKITSNDSYFGGITQKDILFVLEYLQNNLGVIIPPKIFTSAKVLNTDVKIDVLVNCDIPKYISSLKERMYKKTSKIEMITHCKEIGFEYSLLVKYTTKSGKDSLTIYAKLEELKAHKNSDFGYFDSFDKKFLELHKNTIRIERRLQSFSAMRKAFKLKHKGDIKLYELLNSTINIVKERLNELLGDE